MTGRDIAHTLLTGEEFDNWLINMRHHGDNNADEVLDTEYQSGELYRFISSYFSWEDTDEGIRYWDNICTRVANGTVVREIGESFIITKHKFV